MKPRNKRAGAAATREQEIIELRITKIVVDPTVNVRHGELDPVTVDSYSENPNMPPVDVMVVDGKYVLADGEHRLHGASQRGDKTINAIVVGAGTLDDVREYSDHANLKHGLPLTRDLKREVARRLHARHPELSKRELAKKLGVTHPTITAWLTDETEKAGKNLPHTSSGAVLAVEPNVTPEVKDRQRDNHSDDQGQPTAADVIRAGSGLIEQAHVPASKAEGEQAAVRAKPSLNETDRLIADCTKALGRCSSAALTVRLHCMAEATGPQVIELADRTQVVLEEIAELLPTLLGRLRTEAPDRADKFVACCEALAELFHKVGQSVQIECPATPVDGGLQS